MAKQGGDEDANATSRSRWATRRLTVKSKSLKQMALRDRMNRKSGSNEKNRHSGGSQTIRNDHDDDATAVDPNSPTEEGDDDDEEEDGRTLFFNIPLPPEMKDEEGHPIVTYTRNKIRTAKYTPLSFIPKNLWYQFHNIANVFFLFLCILVVSTKHSLCLLVALRLTGPNPDFRHFCRC